MEPETYPCPSCDGQAPFFHDEGCRYFTAYVQSFAAATGMSTREAERAILATYPAVATGTAVRVEELARLGVGPEASA